MAERKASQGVAPDDGARKDYEEGHRLTLAGQYAEAMGAYDAALERRPDFAEAYFGRGICHHKLGRLDKALEDMRAAQRLGCGDADTYLAQQPGAQDAASAQKEVPAMGVGQPARKRPSRAPLLLLAAGAMLVAALWRWAAPPGRDGPREIALRSEDVLEVARAAEEVTEPSVLKEISARCEQQAALLVPEEGPEKARAERLIRKGAWLALADRLWARAETR